MKQEDLSLNEAPKNDGFDFSKFRVSEDVASKLGVVKQVVIKIRKPRAQEFVRVHSSEDFQFDTFLLELEEDGNTYLIDPGIKDYLANEISLRRLVTAITRDNEIFLWPLKLAAANGKYNTWNNSTLEAAESAKDKWTRISSNKQEGRYDVHTAAADLLDPRWPEMLFNEILNIAFKDKIIDTLEHPVIKKLKGAI